MRNIAGKAPDKGNVETLTGAINDFRYGAKHTMMKNVTHKQCAIACAKMGSKYAHVAGDNVYELDGKESDLEKFPGTKTKVTGTVDGTKCT